MQTDRSAWIDVGSADELANRPLQQVLLAAAMFALGLGVDLRALVAVGRRPLVLGGAATLLIGAIGLAGAVGRKSPCVVQTHRA